MEDQTTKTYSFLSLNVCGLRKKLQFPDFVTFVCKYDVLCLTETKTDNTDISNIPGFPIRENSVKYIEVLISECEYVFWFKLSRNLSNSSSDILFGVTYVPPENTSYSSSDCFTEYRTRNVEYVKNYLEYNMFIRRFQCKNWQIERLYIYLGNLLANHNNMDEETRQSLEHVNVLLDSNISLEG